MPIAPKASVAKTASPSAQVRRERGDEQRHGGEQKAAGERKLAPDPVDGEDRREQDAQADDVQDETIEVR